MKRFIAKNEAYFPPLFFLIFFIFLVWILFFKFEVLDEGNDRVTAIISSLALILAIFQIWLNRINQRRDKNFQLRYTEFKRQQDLIYQIIEALHTSMTQPNIQDVHGLSGQIINQVNQFRSFVIFESNFLFKNLHEDVSAIELRGLLDKVEQETASLASEIYKLEEQSEDSDFESAMSRIEQFNWHNKVTDLLEEIHRVKLNYFNALHSYL